MSLFVNPYGENLSDISQPSSGMALVPIYKGDCMGWSADYQGKKIKTSVYEKEVHSFNKTSLALAASYTGSAIYFFDIEVGLKHGGFIEFYPYTNSYSTISNFQGDPTSTSNLDDIILSYSAPYNDSGEGDTTFSREASFSMSNSDSSYGDAGGKKCYQYFFQNLAIPFFSYSTTNQTSEASNIYYGHFLGINHIYRYADMINMNAATVKPVSGTNVYLADFPLATYKFPVYPTNSRRASLSLRATSGNSGNVTINVRNNGSVSSLDCWEYIIWAYTSLDD